MILRCPLFVQLQFDCHVPPFWKVAVYESRKAFLLATRCYETITNPTVGLHLAADGRSYALLVQGTVGIESTFTLHAIKEPQCTTLMDDANADRA